MFEIHMVQETLFSLFHIERLSKIGKFWIILIANVFVIVFFRNNYHQFEILIVYLIFRTYFCLKDIYRIFKKCR